MGVQAPTLRHPEQFLPKGRGTEEDGPVTLVGRRPSNEWLGRLEGWMSHLFSSKSGIASSESVIHFCKSVIESSESGFRSTE